MEKKRQQRDDFLVFVGFMGLAVAVLANMWLDHRQQRQITTNATAITKYLEDGNEDLDEALEGVKVLIERTRRILDDR